MNLHPGAEHELNAYARWCHGIWMGDPDGFKDRDLTIMTLGLGGETGEVADLFLDPQQPMDTGLATKEMGDVFYYWSMLCVLHGIAPWACLEKAAGRELSRDLDTASTMAATLSDDPACVVFARMSSKVGVVLEKVKKKVRDGTYNEEDFTLAMGQLAIAWFNLALRLGLVPSAVLRANIDKVESRAARGVMRGSGNER